MDGSDWSWDEHGFDGAGDGHPDDDPNVFGGQDPSWGDPGAGHEWVPGDDGDVGAGDVGAGDVGAGDPGGHDGAGWSGGGGGDLTGSGGDGGSGSGLGFVDAEDPGGDSWGGVGGDGDDGAGGDGGYLDGFGGGDDVDDHGWSAFLTLGAAESGVPFGADPDLSPADDVTGDMGVFPPPLLLDAAVEPVDGYPWADVSSLGPVGGSTEPEVVPAWGGWSAPPVADLLAYADAHPTAGDVDDTRAGGVGVDAARWAALVDDEDPATSALARWWQPPGQ